jgi:hypothetical protein
MAPQIGQRARLNGKDVVWSGTNYGYQSPATHTKLAAQGKFNLGTQALDRLTQYVGNSQIAKNLLKAQQQFRDATDKLGFDKVENAVNRAVAADDKLPASRVAQGGAIAAQHITNRLGIDPRLAMVGMVATGAGGGAIRRTSPGGGAKKTKAQFNAASAPNKSPTHAFADARITPPLNDNWVAVGREARDGRVVDTGAFARLSPEDKIKARQGLLPGSPAEFKGRVYVEPPTNSAVQPKKPIMAQDFVPGPNNISPKDWIDPNHKGSVNNPRPRSQAQFNQPQGTRPQRIHVEGSGGTARLSIGYNVKPEEMAKPRGDGNAYGRAARVAELPEGWVESGNFITNSDTARRHNRDNQRNQFLEGKATVKADPNLSVRDEIAWADGDVTKLNGILERLGGSPQRYASQAQRAIERRLGAKENTYGGKPSLSKAERAQFTDEWDWKNLRGADQPEAKRLSELATKLFGNRGITPEQQAQMARGSAAAQERINGRLNFPKPDANFRTPEPLEQQTRGGRMPSRSVRPPTPTSTKPTERAERLVQGKDAALTQSATTRYQPKLSEEQREAARRARANRSLRSLADRLPKPNQTAIDAILKLITQGK